MQETHRVGVCVGGGGVRRAPPSQHLPLFTTWNLFKPHCLGAFMDDSLKGKTDEIIVGD